MMQLKFGQNIALKQNNMNDHKLATVIKST
jgi:hypothetical protein